MAIQLKDGFQGSRMIVLPSSVREECASGEYTSMLYVTDIGYYPRAQYHYRHRQQGAQEYILIYCTDGKGWINCGGSTYNLTGGTFFVIPPCREHTYGADESDPWSIYWLHFTGSLADSFGKGFDHICEINPAEDSRIASRLDIFEELYNSLEAGYSPAQLNYACSTLVHLLGSFKYIEAYRHSGELAGAGRDVIDRCRHYMMENIEKQLTLGDICSYLGYSPSFCNDLFKKYTGMTPMLYLQNMRIQMAAHLMDVTSMKVNQVCHKVGIDDPYYFSRLFSKMMGIPPREYRKSAK